MSEKILVRGVNWIGDAVMMMPALRSLKKTYSDSLISLLVKPPIPALFEKNPAVAEIIPYDEKFSGVSGKMRLARTLRKKKFSKAVLFQNAFDAAMIAFLSGIPERIGYNRDSRGFLLTRAVPFDGEDRKVHHIDYYLGLLHAAGMKTERSEPWIFLAPEERQSARAALAGLSRPILGINPGATYGSAKRWFPERFAEVAKWFLKDSGGSVVIFGSGNEVSIAEEIEYLIRKETPGVWSRIGSQEEAKRGNPGIETFTDPVVNLAGKTSVRALISFISECDVLVSNDSGPMHIAYAVGTPLVAIFGSTAPGLTGYRGERSVTIRHDFDCSPCFERTCGKGDLRCMCAVTSDEVYLGIREMLPRRKAVFFDRDGTLCKDVGYLNDWKGLQVFPDIESLSALKDRGFALIGVSNQSGIARGLVDESFVREVHGLFIERYGFDDFFYCPHSPQEGCGCRKPEPGMLVDARAKHGVDLKRSYVVGDKDADMILARAVGARGILVRTGQQAASDHADFEVEDLREAVEVIVSNEV